MRRAARVVVRDWSRRAVVAAAGLGLCGAAGFVGAAVLGLVPRSVQIAWPGLWATVSPGQSGLLWAGLAAAAALLGLLLLSLSLGGDAPADDRWLRLSARDSGGTHTGIAVSSRAMVALIAHVAQRQEGVLRAMPRVRLGRKGWMIAVDLELWADRRLASEADGVRAALLEAVPHSTGLPVHSLELRLLEPMSGQPRVA